jgi:membrane protein
MKLKALFERVRKFLLHDLWTLDPTRGWRKAALYSLRIGFLVVENTINRELFVRAAALTYQIVFSIIPLFAVMLALLKSFGGLEKMAVDVRNFLLENLAPNIGEKIVTYMNDVIDRMNVKAISVIGFIILLYTSVSLLSTVEHAFNRIWGVARPRSILKRITVYWTLLTVGPIGIAVSIGVSGFLRSRGGYKWLTENVPLANATILTLLPFVLTWLVFTAVYKIMPNTRVHWRAALIGGLISGTAWELLKRLFVYYNATVTAGYEVYGTLAAIPIFLLWIYLSWVLVLIGAEVSFASQHVKTYRRERDLPKLSQSFKERLAIHLMVEIARDFLAGRSPETAEALSDRLKVPVRAGSQVLTQLADAKLLHEMESKGAMTYMPAEDLTRISVRRIVDALRRLGDNPAIDPTNRDRVEKLYADTDLASAAPLEKVTLRDLAESAPPPADA